MQPEKAQFQLGPQVGGKPAGLFGKAERIGITFLKRARLNGIGSKHIGFRFPAQVPKPPIKINNGQAGRNNCLEDQGIYDYIQPLVFPGYNFGIRKIVGRIQVGIAYHPRNCHGQDTVCRQVAGKLVLQAKTIEPEGNIIRINLWQETGFHFRSFDKAHTGLNITGRKKV